MAKLTRKQIREGLDTIPIDSILLGARTEARLTPKQREFARKIANGTGQTQAYRETYNTKGKKTTQRTNAHLLAKREDIANTVEAFRRAREFTEQHTPAQLRAFVIQQLAQHASDEEMPPAQRIKALQLLGTVSEVAAFTERKEITTVKASGDIRERLMDKLRLIGSSVSDGLLTAPEDHSADDLLAEIAQGNADNAEENNADENEATPSDANAPDCDPTAPAPPEEFSTTLYNDTHSIPHTQSPSETSVSLEQCSSDNTDTL